MKVFYLKATDEAVLCAALKSAGITGDDPRFLIDMIGAIALPTGETEAAEDGVEVPVMEALDGFFANLAVLCPEPTDDPEAPVRWLSEEAEGALVDCIIPNPSTPFRVWA